MRRGLRPSDVDDGLGEGPWRFLRQVVPDAARDDLVLVSPRELPGIGAGVGVWCAIGVALQGDGGHGDGGTRGQPPLQIGVLRIAVSQAEPPAVIVDDNSDMIWVVEGRRAALERRIVEVPPGRGELPDELVEV